MVRIKDIAAKVGVSPATVSRCLNGNQRVNPAVRERVLQAARELDYRPNAVARNLVSAKSYLLGVVVPDIANPFFGDIVRAIDDVARTYGYNILVCNTDKDIQRETTVLRVMSSRQVDGILLAPSEVEPHLENCKSLSIPVGIITRFADGFDSIETNHEKGGWLVAKHFADLGHIRMAYVGERTGPKYDGFRQAAIELNIRESDILACTSSANIGSIDVAYQLTLNLMNNKPERPTAIFAINDLCAIGVIKALEELNIRIPQDVAVAGFDNTVLAVAARPPLTTVAQPTYELGRIATEHLLEQINSTNTLKPRHVVIEPRLIVRESTSGVTVRRPCAAAM